VGEISNGAWVFWIGEEDVRLCCFFVRGDGVVFAEDDEEKLVLLFVSLVERNIDLEDVVMEEDEEDDLNWAGVRRPNPTATKTLLISNILRAKERSVVGVEQVEAEEEPKRKENAIVRTDS
jgi:hypothetical protein